MKKAVSKETVSQFRQEVVLLTDKLKAHALKAGDSALLFQGVPCEVYRTCGKVRCRCMISGKRHGPYKVIQVWHGKRSRQVTLKKEDEHFFEMAKRYQFQQQNRAQIVKLQEEILKAVDTMLERRSIWKKE